MPTKRFLMNAGRTTKQGQQINVGKDYPEYQAIVSTLTMHPEDMKAVGVAPGGTVRVRYAHGEATFQCIEGKVPPGMIFVPYGPPTCRLMGGGHRRHGDAHLQGLGGRGGAGRIRGPIVSAARRMMTRDGRVRPAQRSPVETGDAAGRRPRPTAARPGS